MRLRAKVIVAMRQWLVATRASAPAAGTCLGVMLFKFATNKDRQATLWGCKGLAGTKLGLDKDLTPTQQVRKSELWSLFKEAKAAGEHSFWRIAELFVGDT